MKAAWKKNEDPEGLLKKIQCFLLDMDGTLYLDDQWIEGAPDFLRRIDGQGKKYVLLTNNSSKSREAYYKKLEKMGLRIGPEQLVTSSDATMSYISREMPGKKVFLMGNAALKEEFRRNGIALDEENPDLVVTAFDTEFDYARLVKLCGLVRSGLPFIATHPDLNCPTKTGFAPDIGALHAYVEASAGRRPDIIIGKPNREIVEYTLRLTGTDRVHTAMVGDRLYTDIPTGVRNGLLSVCVLSGESTLAQASEYEIQPHLVFDSVKAMIPFL